MICETRSAHPFYRADRHQIERTASEGLVERLATALELANAEAERLGFQYICKINSDDLPRAELGEGSPVLQKIAIELHDPAGMLLGVEF